jgi:hypothetical protein
LTQRGFVRHDSGQSVPVLFWAWLALAAIGGAWNTYIATTRDRYRARAVVAAVGLWLQAVVLLGLRMA